MTLLRRTSVSRWRRTNPWSRSTWRWKRWKALTSFIPEISGKQDQPGHNCSSFWIACIGKVFNLLQLEAFWRHNRIKVPITCVLFNPLYSVHMNIVLRIWFKSSGQERPFGNPCGRPATREDGTSVGGSLYFRMKYIYAHFLVRLLRKKC